MTSRRRSHFGKRGVTGAGLLAAAMVTSIFLLVPVEAGAFATTTVNGTNPASLTLAVGETKIVTFKVVNEAFNPISGLPVTIFYYTAYSYNGDPYFSVRPLASATDASGQLPFEVTGTQPAVGRIVQFLISLPAFDNANLVVNVTTPGLGFPLKGTSPGVNDSE